jgi:hypothetical protein
MAVDVMEIGALGTCDKRGLAADGTEGTRGAVDAAGNHAVGPSEGLMALGEAETGLGKGWGG